MSHRAFGRLVSPVSPLALMLAVACFGDVTSSRGALGRLEYSLYTDYDGQQDELTDLPLLTNHSHSIDVELTQRGKREAAGDGGSVIHTVEGIEGIEIESGAADEDSQDPPDFEIESPVAGEATITSTLREEVFDTIELRFESPTRLDVIGWSRAPWEEDWMPFASEVLTVQEGTQISFLVLPMYKSTRIGGEFTPTITVDPPELAVLDVGVMAVQEDGMTTAGEPVTFYAIEPGFVTFTLSDPANNIETERVVEITPLVLP